MRRLLPPILTAFALMAMLASPLAAQLQLPGLPSPVPNVGRAVGDLNERLGETTRNADRTVTREALRLLRLRERALDRLLRQNDDLIERDAGGALARRGELLAFGASDAALAELDRAGFRVAGREMVEGLEFGVVRLHVPLGMTLADAERLGARLVPGLELSPDHLHFEAGSGTSPPSPALVPLALAARPVPAINLPIGIIDGGSGSAVPVAAQKGFARGAPRASDHGSAIASLLHSTGARQLWVADVYGSDPVGGNALAIAKALGWLVASGCRVVTISLVGPRNALVERAIAAARRRGVVVIAAVGNDGPAAPPAFPASYEGVLAITGVDRKGRVLIEAGRALHLDYAAPGAQVHALDGRGRGRMLRGTSFAAPLAASRVAAALERGGSWRARLDEEARDLGAKGPDGTFGRGLLCEGCGRKN